MTQFRIPYLVFAKTFFFTLFSAHLMESFHLRMQSDPSTIFQFKIKSLMERNIYLNGFEFLVIVTSLMSLTNSFDCAKKDWWASIKCWSFFFNHLHLIRLEIYWLRENVPRLVKMVRFSIFQLTWHKSKIGKYEQKRKFKMKHSWWDITFWGGWLGSYQRSKESFACIEFLMDLLRNKRNESEMKIDDEIPNVFTYKSL